MASVFDDDSKDGVTLIMSWEETKELFDNLPVTEDEDSHLFWVRHVLEYSLEKRKVWEDRESETESVTYVSR